MTKSEIKKFVNDFAGKKVTIRYCKLPKSEDHVAGKADVENDAILISEKFLKVNDKVQIAIMLARQLPLG